MESERREPLCVQSTLGRQRPRFDRPTTARQGTRSLILSAVLHLAIGAPLLTVAVLAREYQPVVLGVETMSVAAVQAQPLVEHQPLQSSFQSPQREEHAAPAYAPEMAEPVLREAAFDEPVVALRDPLLAGGLGRRFAPRRTRPGPAGESAAADAGGPEPAAGGTGDKPASVAPAPDPVITRPVLRSKPFDPARDYPRRALERGWQGVVHVELVVAVDGSVKSVRVLEERSTRRRVLVAKAVEIAKRWTFTPATRDGVPFECTYTPGAIHFRIEDS